MNNQQMIQEIRWVVRSKLHNNWILVSIDIMKRKQEYYYNLSLSRVLSALGHWYWYDFSNKMIMFMKDSFIDGIYWYLLKEDKSDAYLDDQSDETIKAIREIICKCDHVGDWVVYMTNPAQYKCKKCWEMFK